MKEKEEIDEKEISNIYQKRQVLKDEVEIVKLRNKIKVQK
jgi:hypothetical protein